MASNSPSWRTFTAPAIFAGECAGFLKMMLASTAQGMKKRMAQPDGTGWGPSRPKGSALRPATSALMRASSSRAGCLSAADAAGFGFPEDKPDAPERDPAGRRQEILNTLHGNAKFPEARARVYSPTVEAGSAGGTECR